MSAGVRCADFLVDDLGVARREEVGHRVFFVSGREEVEWGEEETRGRKPEGKSRGQEERRREFDRLERLLADSLSSTLVATKYSAHTRSGFCSS